MAKIENQTAEVINNIDLLNSQTQDYPLVSNLPKEPLYAFEFIWRKKEIDYIKNIITCWKWWYKLSIEGVWWLWKSTLAYEICEQLIKEKAVNISLWFTAKDEDFTINLENYQWNFFDTISFLKEAITLLWYPSINIKESWIEELKMLFKQIISKQCLKWKIIFVLDNLETVKDQSFFDLINEMKLFQGDFYLLITSRNSLSLNNENNIILNPFSRDDMEKIISNFQKFFRLGKLKLNLDTLINYCSWNPLISRIIIQKMVYSNTHQIYNDYIKDSWEKKQEILTYIFKNTFDNLHEESKYLLLILAYFDSVDEYILIEIENVFKEYFWNHFWILSIIEKELRKTFFIVYTSSNTSSFWIEKILLEEFVKSFLVSLQTNEAMELYSRINIEIIKKDQRYIKYKKIAEDYWAKNKLESSEISKIIDLESEFKKRTINLEQFLEKLKREEKLYPNIPYINLVISKTIKNFNNWVISEAIIYWEKALSSARRNLKEPRFLQHYIYNLLWLYWSSKIYDKIYELSRELISLGIFKIETCNKIVRHELNIWEVEKAYNSATYWFNIIKDDINKYFKDSKFELENFLIHYYKSASAVWEFWIIKMVYSIIQNHWINYDWDLHFNINDDFKKIKEIYEEWWIERLKSHQLIKIYEKRYVKDFIDKTEFIEFLENRSKVDSENWYIYYNLYKLTSNVDYLYLAIKYSPNEEKYLIAICIELTKYWWERIWEILEYADKWINLNPDNICFFWYKWLYFSKKWDIENAIKNFEKWIENYNKLENSQKENTFNKKNYETILDNLNKNKDYIL